jgi:hypothetical protein
MRFKIKAEPELFQKGHSQEYTQEPGAYLHLLLPKGFPKTSLELNPAIGRSFKNPKSRIIVKT